MAMKCGNCHRKTSAKSTQASGSNFPRAAAHPISGGAAPGNAPANVQSDVVLFSGVYMNRYVNSVSTAKKQTRTFTARAKYAAPTPDSEIPNQRAWIGSILPDATGRLDVRRICAS